MKQVWLKEYEEAVEKMALNWTMAMGGDEVRFTIYPPAGQEFSFSVTINDTDDLECLDQKVLNYYINFDVSYETYIWLDNRGHGANGAPYEMEDVLNDTKWIDDALEQLSDVLLEVELSDDVGLQIGDKVKMNDVAIENYGEEYRDKTFTVSKISRSTKDHPGYDEGLAGEALYDFEELEFSLYDYEVYEV